MILLKSPRSKKAPFSADQNTLGKNQKRLYAICAQNFELHFEPNICLSAKPGVFQQNHKWKKIGRRRTRPRPPPGLVDKTVALALCPRPCALPPGLGGAAH